MSHDELSRRQFLQTSAAIAGAVVLTGCNTIAGGLQTPVSAAPAMPAAPAAPPVAAAAAVKRSATDQVILGNTGMKLSRLGMGTGAANGRTQIVNGKDGFIKLIHAAYDKGLTFFDSCDRYDTTQFMGEALKGLPRDKLFIQSKITGQPANTLSAIQNELKRLNIDYFDSLLVHSQTVANWTSMDSWKRVMDGFNQAKDKKLIRARGTSAHNLPALIAAVNSDFHDLHLVRVNPQGKFVDGPSGRGYTESETFPVDPVIAQIKSMHEKGRGVIGMKIMGNGLFVNAEDREKSVRFAMSQKEIHAVLIGFKNPEEIDEAIERINRALADAA